MQRKTTFVATIFGIAVIGAVAVLYLLWRPEQLPPADLAMRSSLPKPPPPPPWYFQISDPLPRGTIAGPWRPQKVPEIVRPFWNWGDTSDPLCCVAPTAVRNHADAYGWHVVRVTGAKERLVRRVPPNLPGGCGVTRLQGVVKLDVVIGEDGKPLLIGVLSGPPSLVQAALAAVREWRCEPVLVNRKAQKAQITVAVNFTLK